MTEPSMRPVRERSAWTRADLERDRSWIVPFGEPELAALDRAYRAVAARGLAWHDVRREDFALPGLEPLLARVRHEIADGLGMVVLRGFPVDRYPLDAIRTIFWGLGTHLGTALTQNAAADLIGEVYDRGLHYGDRNVRAYQVNAELRLHGDNTDLVGLMCVRRAAAGGETILTSATSAYNRLLERHPTLLPLLFNGFVYDRKGEQGPDEPPFSQKIPVFSETAGRVSCRYARSYIEHAERTTGIRLTPLERAALDALDAACSDPELAVEFMLEPGDIQFANNYTVLHARRAYRDDPAAKRLMLRLWLEADWVRPVEDPLVRWGFIRYGNCGKSAADLHGAPAPAGRPAAPHPREPAR